MITLDKRIKPNKKPLDCFDTEIAKSYIGKECYFAFYVSEFSDLSKTHKRVLTGFQSSDRQTDRCLNTKSLVLSKFQNPISMSITQEMSHE